MIFRRRRFATALLGAVVTLAAAACTSNAAVVPGPEPAPAVAAFAAAWQGLKADPIAALTDDPGSARQEVGSVLENLAPGRLGVTATNVRKTGDLTATATADFSWTLADGISWKYTANWTFSRAAPSDDWKATWAATMINPRLGEAQSVQLKTVPATSGSILDRDQLQILSPTKIYSVVALPDKVGNASTTAAALARILGPLDPTVTAASVRAGLAAATAATGYTVTNLREAEYQQVRSELNTVNRAQRAHVDPQPACLQGLRPRVAVRGATGGQEADAGHCRLGDRRRRRHRRRAGDPGVPTRQARRQRHPHPRYRGAEGGRGRPGRL